jgi:hypothetical protein
MANGNFSWVTGYFTKPDGEVVACSLHETDLADAIGRFPEQWSLTPPSPKAEEKKPVTPKS